jgi:putative DNA primase/helicase
MLVGTGRNGKGTFLRVMNALLGPENITASSLNDIVSVRFTTASLFGKIANIAGDIDATYLESTATFKAITGQDQIQAEHKGRPRFDFTPWCVPVFSANKIPANADVTVGYMSRWLVIEFPNDFTGREDRRLDEKLTKPDELSGDSS